MSFRGGVKDSFWLPTHLPDCLGLYDVSFRRRRPLKLPLSCEVEKGHFGPRYVGGGYPHFGHMSPNRTYFRACGRFWLSSVQRAPRVAGDKLVEKEDTGRRIGVNLSPPSMSGSLIMKPWTSLPKMHIFLCHRLKIVL